MRFEVVVVSAFQPDDGIAVILRDLPRNSALEDELPGYVVDQLIYDPDEDPMLLHVDLTHFPEIREDVVAEVGALVKRIEIPRSNAGLSSVYESLPVIASANDLLSVLRGLS